MACAQGLVPGRRAQRLVPGAQKERSSARACAGRGGVHKGFFLVPRGSAGLCSGKMRLGFNATANLICDAANPSWIPNLFSKENVPRRRGFLGVTAIANFQ